MTTAIRESDNYLASFAQFEKDFGHSARPSLRRLHNAAIARFAELGFPNERDEDWKFTNLAPLVQIPFECPAYDDQTPPPEFGQLTAGDEPGCSLMVVNGYRPWRLDAGTPLPDGVIVCGLAEALEKHPELVEAHLARYADYKDHALVALNTAFLRDGVFVYLPQNVVVKHPIRIGTMMTAFGRQFAWHRRCLIVAASGSQATIVEEFSGLPGHVYFTNAVTEIVLADNARIDHYKVQQEGEEAYHLAVTQVQQDRNSNFSSHFVSLGGRLVRNEVRAVLNGEGGECTLNGLYLANGKQHVDNRTTIDHAKPHCASHEVYKGILDGKAHGIFNGKIFVRQDAQKTDAKQTNKTLLLSEDATINTKPQLEIFADDVKCTHGATVGQLDDEAIFYLRSRGLGLDEARGLLTYAFANDIISRIRVEPLRVQLERHLLLGRRLQEKSSGQEAS